jgi:hypothetical protein
VANVLTVVWIVIGYVVTNASLLIWAALMLPNPVERARQRLETKPVASFFLGMLFWAVTAVFSGAMLQNNTPGPVKLLGWLLAGPMLAGSVIGGAAFARLLAGRIQPRTSNGSPIQALVGGALCTTMAALVPVIGWFVFLPLAGFMSIGAGMLGVFSKREVAAERQPAPERFSQPPQEASHPDPQFLLPDV